MIWTAYLAGALLALAYKFCRYLQESKLWGSNLKQATLEWFFEPSQDNAVSWVTTVGAVWVLGYLYVDQATAYFDWIPIHASVAFLLGTLAEMIAPAFAKWFAARVLKPFREGV